MKILFVHTSYAERGGEDAVFENEYKQLSACADVEKLTFTNTGKPAAVALKFLSAPWNFSAAARLKKAIKAFKPDVVHIHNWYFAASPALIRTAKNCKVPVVVTLHNYRLLCPSATLFNNGSLFHDSLSKGFPWLAVKKKVYRNSAIQTFWLALAVHLHKKIHTWNQVSKYIALTPFAQKLFVDSNLRLKADQVTVKSNFVEDKGFTIKERGQHFLFVGRLTQDKGIQVLLKAFAGTDKRLKIIGNGPLKNLVLDAVTKHSNIDYQGLKSNAEIIAAMKKASALIFPSIWYEGMPMTILEAFSSATPVIASCLGAMESLIQHQVNGLLFNAADTNDLISKIDFWQRLSNADKETICTNARKSYEDNYTPIKSIHTALAIYNSAIIETFDSNNCNINSDLLHDQLITEHNV